MINELLKKVMMTFEGSFINRNFELILIPKTNLYFRLEDVDSELTLKCKILEWSSRHACKQQFYKSEKSNNKYHKMVLNNINKSLDTNFSNYDICCIYNRLGNSINRELTIKFINSGYDIDLLR